MVTYAFERLSVFLIEDNAFVRNTLKELLRSFGLDVRTADNGEKGIAYLKDVARTARTGGAGVPDIVISDLVMKPINGLLMLRWMRMAKDSPNRFLPFVMLSGAADFEYVESARDLGVTEFLAKPFSAMSVYEHLLNVIDRPRPFIATKTYFGPDRRRHAGGLSGRERRDADKTVTVVYSADKVVKPQSPSDVWRFQLPNSLQVKAAGGEVPKGTVGDFPLAVLEEAEQQLERAQLDFTKWAAQYLARLSTLCGDALETSGPRERIFDDINLLALELRGQGGTFGYPLVSQIGKMLFDATVEGCRTDDTGVAIVRAHIDSMRAVLKDKVSGDGGEVGRAVIKGLMQTIEKRRAAP
jgi:CheY-like chemotaxis protein